MECNRSDGNDNLMDKIVGITTDGESANTGKKGGSWQLFPNKLQRNLITVCFVCHRSDLAIESVQSSAQELKHWMSDVIAVSTFFRASARRTKELHKVSILYLFCLFRNVLFRFVLYVINGSIWFSFILLSNGIRLALINQGTTTMRKLCYLSSIIEDCSKIIWDLF